MLNTSASFLRPLCVLLLAPAIAACDAPDPAFDDDESILDDDLQIDDELTLDDDGTGLLIGGLTTGRRLNTNSAGGHEFDELPLFGGEHEGVQLIGIDYYPGGISQGPFVPIEPVDVASIYVDATMLKAYTMYGLPLEHQDFGNTLWHIATPTGEYDLLVEATQDMNSGTFLYEFRWKPHGSTEDPQPTCLMPGEEPLTTAAVYRDLNIHPDGQMNLHPGLLNIACIAGAPGKLALWQRGFESGAIPATYPWNALDVFEAYVRVVRADYCGDGGSATLPGTPIYMQDTMGYDSISPATTPFWAPPDEALWDLDKAVCVNVPRLHNSLWAQPTCNGVPIPTCSSWAMNNWFYDPSILVRTASP